MPDFKGRRFPVSIILVCVRWYCKYGISYRDLEEMMAERGVQVVWACALKGPARLPVDAVLARVTAWLDTEERAGVVQGMPNSGICDPRQGSI